MSTSLPSLSVTAAARPADRSYGASRQGSRARLRADVLIYLALIAMVGAAWWISLQGWFTPWSRTGYWLGVAGGVSMLLLFTYPLRKRLRRAQAWGASKYWFAAHMVLGVAGPWLILLHSTFHIGSMNAAVALFSMVIVALSGVVGRFLYIRLHTDLRGEKASLAELREALGIQHQVADSRLHAAPNALNHLREFELLVLGERGGQSGRGHLWRLFVLPWMRRDVVIRCKKEFKDTIRHLAKRDRWDKQTAVAQYRFGREQIETYSLAVQRVAQFQSFERLFSLWHVAHVPFVWIMVVCAIFHVVAVHAY